MKNKTYYIVIIFLGLILRVISLIIYLFVWLFRSTTLKWAEEHFEENEYKMFVMRKNYKKWKVYFRIRFWFFCFTTGLTNNYSGHYWFMRKKKEKWFPWLIEPYNKLKEEANKFLDVAYPLRDKWYQKLRYFWICYRWQALRNSHWAFNEWFFREGKWKEGTQKVIYCIPNKGSIDKYWDIKPQLKWDEGVNIGKELRWQDNTTPIEEIWLCTHEGKKLITFTTNKGNKRFMYAFCKVKKFKKYLLMIEHLFGWNWWNGIPVLHNKYIFRKINNVPNQI